MIRNKEINFYAPCGSMWHLDYNPTTGSYRDRYNVWIVAIEDGVRYMKHYSITGARREDGSGLIGLIADMHDIVDIGAKAFGMTVVGDGDKLPYSE